jgi:hypothetical protein
MTMTRNKHGLTRRDLIKAFGPLAFLLMPVVRSMGYAAGTPFAGMPRFVLFFKGPSFHSPTVTPTTSINSLPAPLASLAPHAQDLILFTGMNIHGGSPKTDGYQEEHAAGLIGCSTGNSYHYSKNDSYYAYTDNESIDIAIANHYLTVPALASLPFASLHLGVGAQSDADNVGLGQRYISYRKRQAGDAQYGNAIEPIQDAGQVYDMLMQRVNVLCAKDSMQPGTDMAQLRAALQRKKSLIDFRLADIADAKRTLGMDSVHAQKLDGLVNGWREVEAATNAELAGLDAGTGGGGTRPCPTVTRPTGNAQNKNNCDQLAPVADQMIALVKLAFEWDLTRVVAMTMSGASSGHRWPSQGVDKAHHTLEHSNDVAGQNVMGTYFAGKFALLLSALKGIDDGGGKTALYNSSVMLGMECWSDSSNGHYLKNIPFMFAGQGAGAFTTGRVVAAGGRNNNDLLVSIQNASGIASSTFGLASLCKGPII